MLSNGKEVECRVLYEDDQELVYRAGRKEQRVPHIEVLNVQSVERSMREFLARWDPLSSKDLKGLAALAQWAEENDLPGEAHNLWIRIIATDPVNEQAWTKLGGVKGKKGWRLQVRGRFYDLEELRDRVGDWKNALELSTAHFILKTDGDPLRALDAAIDVERAYQAFYDVIGKPLKLFVFDEEPEIHAYADEKDYPTPPSGSGRVWFSPGTNELNVNLAANPTPNEVVAELTQMLVFNAFRRSADTKTGELEPWAQHGLMQAFAVAVRPKPGRVEFEFAPPYVPWFERQAKDKQPVELERVLTSGRGAYEGGPDAERYSVGAYTLVHFLVFHQDGKYRTALATFLRDSFLGKGGKSRFLETVGVGEDALEKEWKDYVASIGGR